METCYIAAYRNDGFRFAKVKESKLEEFRARWDKTGIYFIVKSTDFHKALCRLI